MSEDKMPYRRFRSRGRKVDPETGLAELERLNASAEAPPEAAAARWPEEPAWSEPAPEEHRAAPHKRRLWRLRGVGPLGLVWRATVLFSTAFVVWAVLGFVALWRAAGDSNGGITPAARAALADPGGGLLSTIENTLIIGSDARPGETRARADTIMIMRTDPDSGRIKYLSIPRDWRVSLPRYGHEKINAAFQLLGQRGIMRAVTRQTGIPIHHLIVVRFGGLPKVVDAVGGVDVTNATALNCGYSGGRKVHFDRGRVHLDGQRALEFSRVRYNCGDDFSRMARQQALIAAIRGKLLSPMSLPMAPWRGAATIRAITTDLGAIDLAKLGWLQASMKNDPADRLRLIGSSETIGRQSYVIISGDQAAPVLRQFLGRA